MDFILPMLIVVVGTFLLPLFLLPICSTNQNDQDSEETPVARFIVGYGSLTGISFIIMSALFWIWCFAVDLSKHWH